MNTWIIVILEEDFTGEERAKPQREWPRTPFMHKVVDNLVIKPFTRTKSFEVGERYVRNLSVQHLSITTCLCNIRSLDIRARSGLTSDIIISSWALVLRGLLSNTSYQFDCVRCFSSRTSLRKEQRPCKILFTAPSAGVSLWIPKPRWKLFCRPGRTSRKTLNARSSLILAQ